jgi:hypothetical protein
MATDSCYGGEHDRKGCSFSLAVLELFSYDSKGERFSFDHCFFLRSAVCEYSREFRYLGEPPTIVFSFALERVVHDAVPFNATSLLQSCFCDA